MFLLRLAAGRALHASASSRPGAFAASRRCIGVTPALRDTYAPLDIPEADPMKVFDEIDADGDGVISREEFEAAVERMRYSDLLRLHEAAAANMDALSGKIEQIERIEAGMSELKETYKKKKHAYENVGWMTAGDIDVLFDDAARQKKNISDDVQDLKKLLLEAKEALNG